jgi:hypothetical protein
MKKQYTLNDVKKDLEKIQATVTHIDNSFYSELYTVRTPTEAKQVFSRLTKKVKQGQDIELIIHRVIE